MTRITATIEVAARPSDLFPWLVEPDLLARWIRGFVSSEAMTDPPTRVGSRSRDVIQDGGRRMVIETEILELVPDHLLRVHIRFDGGESHDQYALEPVNSGIRLTYTSETRLKGPYRLLSLIVARQLRERAERDLAALRNAVEAAGDASQPRDVRARP